MQKCHTCKFWDDKVYKPSETAIPSSDLIHRGCRRFPTLEWKKPDDWCGEHQPRVLHRISADEIERLQKELDECEKALESYKAMVR